MKLGTLAALTVLLSSLASFASADDLWVVYPGGEGPGKGKHIVLLAGDEEYRSEETMPMLGKLLSQRHGFKCTVLFSIDPDTGEIDPKNQTNIPGLEALDSADMVILAWRFRELPDADMKHFVDYLETGKPIMGLRTATHAFNYTRHKDSPYAKYSFNSRDWPGGFGRQILGDTWINHHGSHKHESTRGVINTKYADHPILRGVDDLWGPTDVYGVKNLTDKAKVLVRGQVLKGMKPDDEPNPNKKMMPLVWIQEYQVDEGKPGTAICTTMGASVDFKCEDLRRLVVNSCYWALGMGDKITPDLIVEPVGEFKPTFYGFGEFKKGVKPGDYKLD